MATHAQRLPLLALLLLPGALTAFLCFRSGGFFPGAPALLAAQLALVLALRAAVARRPLEGLSPALVVAAVALGALALWTFASSGWSGAEGRAVIETSRVLLYLLVLLVFGTLARTVRRIRWMVYGLATAIVAVCLTALAARLFPQLGLAEAAVHPERLSHPLTYWNALGLLAGIGTVLCGHLASSEREPAVARVLGAAAVPLLAATLYYTFSRGATWAALVAVVIYAVVAHPRGLLAAAVATVPAAVIALMTVNPASVLTGDPTSAAAVEAGRRIALTLAGCAVGAGLVRTLLLPLDTRLRRIELSPTRRRAVLGGMAGMAAAALLVAAVAVDAPRVVTEKVEEFRAERSVAGAGGSSRLVQFGNNGRLEHWQVAVDSYQADHRQGHGAGTYALDWDRDRPGSLDVENAHSLYLEVLGELGLPGLIALAVCLVAILGAFAVRARGPDRAVFAALLAAGSAWAVHAGVDWDWEMPAVTLWLFALGGAALASGPRPAAARVPRPLGPVLRVAGVAACLALAVLPVRVALSEARLDDALVALRGGDCRTATDKANASLEALEARADPFQVIAFCMLAEDRPVDALAAMEQGARRDPENWEMQYGLAVARAAAGQDPRPAARRAAALNPLGTLSQEGMERFAISERDAWRAQGRAAPLTLPD
jgi:hypothetical protein